MHSGSVVSPGSETVPFFIPARTPQLMDIVLNAAGTRIGALVTRKEKKSEPKQMIHYTIFIIWVSSLFKNAFTVFSV